MKKSKIQQKSIIVIGCFFLLTLLFNSCFLNDKIGINYTKHWNGSDKPGHSYASFTDFNGRQDFNITLPSKGIYYLKYSVTVNSGKLDFRIKSNSATVIDKPVIEGTLTDSIKITNADNERYKIYFSAKHASGNFDISYALVK